MIYAVIIPILLFWGLALIQWIRAKTQKRRRQKLKILCNMLYGETAKRIWIDTDSVKVLEMGETNEKNNGKHI